MAITDAQIARLKRMCPAAQQADLGELIRAAEAGGLTAGDALEIVEGVIDVADGGITAEKLAEALVSALRENALAGLTPGETVIRRQITLAAGNPTTVQIAGDEDHATLLGDETEPFELDHGETFIVNPNGVGEQTWTIEGTAGTSESDSDPMTDTSAEADNRIAIAVDGGDPEEVEFDWSAGGGTDTGTKIAAEMEAKIQALGGDFAGVTVVYDNGVYTLTSGNLGTASAVVITKASTHNCTEELKLGVADGGTESPGTGDAAILARTTAEEAAAKIGALHAQLDASAEGGAIRLVAAGETPGGGSSLVIGAGTANAALGFENTQADYGDIGLGIGRDMADDEYTVVITPVTTTPGTAPKCVSIHNKLVGSFDVYQETAAAIPAEVVVIGALAE